MVNLNVGYIRPNRALSTLTAEVSAVYGRPPRPYEYVTGYKSATNYSGHNADVNGIAHAVDIFTDAGTNLDHYQGWAVAEHLRRLGASGDPRVLYVIYRDRIASAGTGWAWAGSGYDHWDHIHLSVWDLYWGDPVSLPPAVYDSTASWGLATAPQAGAITPQTNTITPIQEDALSAQDVSRILADIATVHETVIAARNEATNAKVNAEQAVTGAWTAANEATNSKILGIENAARLTALQATVENLAAGQGATPGSTSDAIDKAVAGAVKAIADQLTAAADKVGD